MVDWIVIGIAACASLIIPGAILCIRNSVKHHRREIITALERIFDPQPANAPRDKVVPSFEFVKFKYFLGGTGPAAADEGPARTKDFPLWSFLVAALPLIVVTFLFGIVSFGAFARSVLGEDFKFLPLLRIFEGNPPSMTSWMIVLAVAYVAAYLFVMRSLMQAVFTFDLSPASFLGGALNMLTAGFTATLLPFIGYELLSATGGALTGALIVAAFLIGMIPELGFRTFARMTRLSLFKREDDQLYEAFKSTPPEVIDGIDSNIRSRLSNYSISSVQNLATANPIMLFVETPYGVYQIIDWVAQAQLCAAVGPKALTDLWKLDIRTIFDFERAVLEEGFTTRDLRHVVGHVVLAGEPRYQKKLGLSLDAEPTDGSDETVMALARVILDDIHIQRLRQIWNRISQRLGPENLEIELIPGRLARRLLRGRPEDAGKGADRLAAA